MPTAQASSPPFGATTTLGGGGGGGGGGGITAESDPVLWYDVTNDTYFYRHVVKDDTGTITGVSTTNTVGGAYTPGATIEPVGARYGLNAEADQIVFVDQGAADTPFLRRYVKNAAGATTSTVDTQLNGTSAYTVVGPIAPYSGPAFSGLTAEADQTVLYDTSAKAFFLRRYVKNAAGAVTSKVDTQLNGTSAFTVSAEGNVSAAPIQAARGPNVAVTYTRVTTATTTAIAAGALAVQYYVVAATVTVNGAPIPAGVGVTHDIVGATTAALSIVTSGGTPDVLIIEERAV